MALLPVTPLEVEEVAEASEAAAGDGAPMATGVIGGEVLTA